MAAKALHITLYAPLPQPRPVGIASLPPYRAPLPRRAHTGRGDPARGSHDDDNSEGPLANLFDPNASSAPEYSDYMNFEDSPPGHRTGFVAIVGRPNAGKSTLLNAILGQTLSIVTHKAQTTRHRILGIWSEPGHQAVFIDTPGIIVDRRDQLEDRMMGVVETAVSDADALLAIVDASSRRPESALDMFQTEGTEEWMGPPMAVLLNKVDLVPQERVEELKTYFTENFRANKGKNPTKVIPISALQRQNVSDVAEWVVSQLPEGAACYPKDIVAEAPERFFVAEIIRRQVFLQYRQELPYQVAVEVVEFKERRPPAKTLVRAHVLVDKKRHVGLLLGAGGAAIKALSTAAREEAEEFLDRPIYLDISVKVAEKWRRDAKQLERLGY